MRDTFKILIILAQNVTRMKADYKLTRIVTGKPLPRAGHSYLKVEHGAMHAAVEVKMGGSPEQYKLIANAIAKDLDRKGATAALGFAAEKVQHILKPAEPLKWWQRILKFLRLWKN